MRKKIDVKFAVFIIVTITGYLLGGLYGFMDLKIKVERIDEKVHHIAKQIDKIEHKLENDSFAFGGAVK